MPSESFLRKHNRASLTIHSSHLINEGDKLIVEGFDLLPLLLLHSRNLWINLDPKRLQQVWVDSDCMDAPPFPKAAKAFIVHTDNTSDIATQTSSAETFWPIASAMTIPTTKTLAAECFVSVMAAALVASCSGLAVGPCTLTAKFLILCNSGTKAHWPKTVAKRRSPVALPATQVCSGVSPAMLKEAEGGGHIAARMEPTARNIIPSPIKGFRGAALPAHDG